MNDQQPEYLSASPTVMAYDYTNGDYFAPAYLGQQTPAQASAAAVAAVGPTRMQIAQPAPLVGHPTPNYPRVGHTPTFTMPMNKGEWNIRGVNMPSYSPALPRMPGSDWATFPQPIDGAQLSAARPQFSAFAGIGQDYGGVDYTRPGIGASREVQDGAYRYRQFRDGAIMVLVSPRPDLLAPSTILTGLNASDPGYQSWVAITTKIGAWKDFVNARSANILTTVTDTALKVAATPFGRKKKKKRSAASAAPASMVPGAPLVVEEEKGFMDGPLPWVIGGSVLVLGIVLLASRSGASKK
jgi:hypothetical protein